MKHIIKVFTLIHVLFWILFSVYVYWESAVEEGPFLRNNLSIGLLLTGLFVFYSHFFILTRYFNKRIYRTYFLCLIGILLLGPLPFMLFLAPEKLATWLHFLTYYGAVMGTVVLIFIILSLLARVIQNLIFNTVKKEQLEKQAINAELDYLKSQINPHFLFNTLNNIHTLVYTQAPVAAEAVMRLSSLMRYMIYESNAFTVSLSLELNYLKDYIGLQQLRYEKTPVVDFQVKGETENCQIAPLLFIHLLENAYKHSPAQLEPGSIKVRVAVNENILLLQLQNPIGNKRDNLLEKTGGIGLPNVQKRLQLLYPNQHSLNITKTDKVFKVELKITHLEKPLNERKANLLYN